MFEVTAIKTVWFRQSCEQVDGIEENSEISYSFYQHLLEDPGGGCLISMKRSEIFPYVIMGQPVNLFEERKKDGSLPYSL